MTPESHFADHFNFSLIFGTPSLDFGNPGGDFGSPGVDFGSWGIDFKGITPYSLGYQ